MIKTDGNGCKHVMNGYGTVASWVETKGNNARLCVSQEPMTPIGYHVGYRNYTEVPEVIISFCNINSVDVWIKALQEIRSELENS